MDSTVTREILKKVRQVELRTRRLVTDALAGEYHSVFKGRGMDFDEVREYTPGDEVRLIDWNVTARTGIAFIKKLREERELTILLAVDVSASGKFGSQAQSKRELAAEVASVLAFSAIRNRDKVGLLLFTDEVEQYIPPTKGRQHVLRVIREILFCAPRRSGTDIASALDFRQRRAAPARGGFRHFRFHRVARGVRAAAPAIAPDQQAARPRPDPFARPARGGAAATRAC